MDHHRRIIPLCTVLLLGAVLLRLLGNTGLLQLRDSRDLASALVFLQTGRLVKIADEPSPTQAETEPAPTEPPAPSPAVFTPDDSALIQCNSYSGDTVDIPALLARPLAWQLRQNTPTVLILHSHATESYTNTEHYVESSEYRTLDENYNMVSVGDHLYRLLEDQGVGVIQDRQFHDNPSYNGSYERSRQSVQSYLQENPSLCLILDLHRDAMVDSQGNQIGYTVDTNSGKAAKVMLVVGAWNDNWQENMALAVKLQARLEQICPGICRPISLRSSRFNQDLSAGALLIEVGAAGNTRQEALRATEILAEAILSLSSGAVYQE